MSIASPRYDYTDVEQRERECREALRDQFLDKVSAKDLYAIQQEAIRAGWGLPELQRAIDALLVEKAAELGEDLPC